MYWWFLLGLLLAGIVMSYAYVLWTLPVLLFAKKLGEAPGDRFSFGLRLFRVLSWSWQSLLFVLWAVFCAAVTVFVAAKPEVSHPWLYYLTGFVCMLLPVLRMAAKGTTGFAFVSSIAVVGAGFVIFCVWPSSMSPIGPVLARILGPVQAKRAPVNYQPKNVLRLNQNIRPDRPSNH